MRYSVLILLFILTFGFAITTKAQFNAISTQVNLELIPENPGPNEVVQASVNSYATNIDGANIVWKINGKTQKSGIGQKMINFTTGDIGTRTTLEVSINTSEGENIYKTVSINPSAVDLIWQTNGFVPPFYRGKTLFSHQNEVTVIAIPHTSATKSEASAKNFIYTWKKDDKAVESASGYGKNTYTFQGSIISRPIKVEVNISSPTSNTTAYGYTTIIPTDPSIIFYKKDPLYGIEFQKALTGVFNIDNISEIGVIAEPFFFGVTDIKSPDLTYKWSINGAFINNQPDSTTQIFRKKDGASGRSNVSISIENSNKVLQYASNNFGLVFNNKTQSPSL